jgi:hypothetical protein
MPKNPDTWSRLALGLGLLSLVAGYPRPIYADATQTEVSPANQSFLARHLQILQLEQYNRFNYMDDGPGVVDSRDLQYRIRTNTQIDLWGEGSTYLSYLRMRAETGQGFNNSWDNTGGGLSPAQTNFYVKTFLLGQRLGPHAELQAGGLEFERGAGSQHTYASDDSAMVGYRARLTGSGHAWQPENFSMTMGYVGDFDQSNFFVRSHMGKLNYAQALAQKQLGRNGTVSAELDSIRGIWFTREAIHWYDAWGGVLDETMVEAVTRTTDNPSFGWSATISRGLDAEKHWHALAIYSDMPQGLYEKQGQVILLNQGEISTGKRLSWGVSDAFSKNLKMELFAGRRLDNTPTLRWVTQFGLSYQYADLVNHLLGRQSPAAIGPR